MTLDLGPKTRKAIYLTAALLSLVVTYLGANGTLDAAQISLVAGLDTLLFSLAAGKVEIVGAPVAEEPAE